MTDYYTCRDCGGSTLSCGCSAERDTERKAYWAAEAKKRGKAIRVVSNALDDMDEDDGRREDYALVILLANRGLAEAVRFSEGHR